MTDIELEQIFISALDAAVGVVVATNNTDLLKKKCYSVRNKARKTGSTAYDCLTFRTSPTAPDTELWIFNGDPKDAATKTES